MASTDSAQKREDTSEVGKSLTVGTFVSLFTSCILIETGHAGWAFGFVVGAGVSLLSLYTLGILVPMLLLPTAPAASQFLLALLMLFKLPLYAGALYLVTCRHGVDPRSAFPGVIVAPFAITSRTVWAMISASRSDAASWRKVRRGMRAGRWRLPLRKTLAAEPAREQG